MFALAGPACILFVNDDPGSLGTSCRFSGQDASACGICLASSCQKAIDSFCISSSCRDRGMAAVDACATGMSDQCLSSDLSPDLSSCIVSACAKECLGGITNCSSGTNECTCNIELHSPNAVACGESTVRNSICCADASWPKNGSCRCTYWGCMIQSTRCDCSPRSFAGSSSDYKDACYPPQGGGYHCCRSSYGSCSCDMSSCLSSETEVPDCSLTSAGCSTGSSLQNKRVTTCTQ